MRAHYFFYVCIGVLLFNSPPARAHSVEQLKAVFDQTPIPEELLEVYEGIGRHGRDELGSRDRS